MYEYYYGLHERPFAITPNPRFVYLSQRHQDALAHLLYGVGTGGSGGFVQLTGEVGTGKTTLCRLVLEQVPDNTRIALILNPSYSPPELLRAICTELEIPLPERSDSLQALQEALNRYLLAAHASGARVVLIIDEAQNMSRESLEQVRLLTNLETATDKLLQILLLGQPELRSLLARPELRQLAQRITARFHLDPLNREETALYVRHRLSVAGAPRCPFTDEALKALFQVSSGVPRLINIIADRALMAGYAEEKDRVDGRLVRAAAREVAGAEEEDRGGGWLRGLIAGLALLAVVASSAWIGWLIIEAADEQASAPRPAWHAVLADASAASAWTETATLWPGLNREDIQRACLSPGVAVDGVACLALRGNWAYIRQINLPVILRMVPDGDGHSAHVLLVGLDDDQVLLRHAGQDLRAPIRQVDRRWLGDFFVVWPDDGTILRRQDQNPAVRLGKELAAQLEMDPWDGRMDDRFDEEFERWVERFQRRNGLRDDGMIGPATRLFLKAPQIAGPSLLNAQQGD